MMNAVKQKLEDFRTKLAITPIVKQGRITILETLVETKEGQQIIESFLNQVMLGSSCTSACVQLGIAQKTFSKWMNKGREEPDSIYGWLRGEYLSAIAIARGDCEILLKSTNPKWYIEHGPGKLLGDNYNAEFQNSKYLHLEDGTVVDQHSIKENADQNELSSGCIEHRIDNKTLVDALIELRMQGQDLNSLVDGMITNKEQTELDKNSEMEKSIGENLKTLE